MSKILLLLVVSKFKFYIKGNLKAKITGLHPNKRLFNFICSTSDLCCFKQVKTYLPILESNLHLSIININQHSCYLHESFSQNYMSFIIYLMSITIKSIGNRNLSTFTKTYSIIPYGYLIDLFTSCNAICVCFILRSLILLITDRGIRFMLAPKSMSVFLTFTLPMEKGNVLFLDQFPSKVGFFE